MSDNVMLETQRETAMVDLAYQLLKEKSEPMLYRDIVDSVSGLKGFTKEQTNQYVPQLYTEINIDGRFVCVGRSLWGLKYWYSLAQTTDSAVAANVKDDDMEEESEEEDFEEEEKEELDEELEN